MPTVIEKRVTQSTNTDAIELAKGGCDHLTVVWAREQTAGRGQRERKWESVEGSVFWSIVFRPDDRWPRFTDVIYVTALAVYDTLRVLLGPAADLKLKWPNDTMLGGCKLGGTLTEASGSYKEGRPDWIVSGTGLNVVPLPPGPDMNYPATSLHQAGFSDVTRDDILPLLLQNTAAGLDGWIRHGFEPVRTRYLEHAFGLNTSIRVGTADRSNYKEGIYLDVDPQGALLLEDRLGRIEKIASGEVIKREPYP